MCEKSGNLYIFVLVKSILFIFIFALQSGALFSQENQTQTLLKVKALQEKKAEYHRRTNGEVEGYRVKIHFSADKAKMKEAQSKFAAKYSDVASYEDYQPVSYTHLDVYKRQTWNCCAGVVVFTICILFSAQACKKRSIRALECSGPWPS